MNGLCICYESRPNNFDVSRVHNHLTFCFVSRTYSGKSCTASGLDTGSHYESIDNVNCNRAHVFRSYFTYFIDMSDIMQQYQ